MASFFALMDRLAEENYNLWRRILMEKNIIMRENEPLPKPLL